MKRLRFIAIFLTGIVLFTGCFRDDSEKLQEQEQRDLKNYLAEHNITQSPTASGLYIIPETDDTTGLKPTINNVVEFEYTGKLVDGTVFGTTDSAVAKDNDIYYSNVVYGTVRLLLSNSIIGLQEGFQLMHEGEKATLILPSDLAYGGNSIGAIGPYKTLIFDIHLWHVITDPASYEQNLIQNFLDSNNYNVEPTESGLYYIEKVSGNDTLIKEGNYVDMYYKGYFLDGRVFDSNFGEDNPIRILIPNENLIDGWNEGLKLMSKGSEGTLIVPYSMAFGSNGTPDYYVFPWYIGPYMTLIFDIKIVGVH